MSKNITSSEQQLAGPRMLSKARMLRNALRGPGLSRFVGASDATTVMLAERHCFAGIWASGLAISTAHGVPDASVLSRADFLDAAVIMNRCGDLPVLADVDTGFGSDVPSLEYLVSCYESAGIAGVCLEDKVFPKRNSFTDSHELIDPDVFATKLTIMKEAQRTPDFAVVARTEALIVGTGMADALHRGKRYQDAGANGLLIHSKATGPDEVLRFADGWFGTGGEIPLLAVPTTYYNASLASLESAGFTMVIFANQALRAALKAVDGVLEALAKADSAEVVNGQIATLTAVLEMVGLSYAEPEVLGAGFRQH